MCVHAHHVSLLACRGKRTRCVCVCACLCACDHHHHISARDTCMTPTQPTHVTRMPAQIELLAEGMSYDGSVAVACLDADPPVARHLAKDILGSHYFPSFMVFPRHSRTYYKYTGGSRDAASLVRFMNMVCKQQEDDLWQLQPPATADKDLGSSSGTLGTAAAAARAATSPPAPSISLPSSMAHGLAASLRPHAPLLGAALLGLASLAVVARILLPGRPPAAGGDPMPAPSNMAVEIDGSLSRLATLMLRLLQARIRLMVGSTPAPTPAAMPPPPSPTPAAAAGGAGSPQHGEALPLPARQGAVAAVTPTASARLGPDSAAPTAGSGSGPSTPPAGSGSALPRGPAVVMAADVRPVVGSSSQQQQLPGPTSPAHRSASGVGQQAPSSPAISRTQAAAASARPAPAPASASPQASALLPYPLNPVKPGGPGERGGPGPGPAVRPGPAMRSLNPGPAKPAGGPQAPVMMDLATATQGALPGQTVESGFTQEQVGFGAGGAQALGARVMGCVKHGRTHGKVERGPGSRGEWPRP